MEAEKEVFLHGNKAAFELAAMPPNGESADTDCVYHKLKKPLGRAFPGSSSGFLAFSLDLFHQLYYDRFL